MPVTRAEPPDWGSAFVVVGAANGRIFTSSAMYCPALAISSNPPADGPGGID